MFSVMNILDRFRLCNISTFQHDMSVMTMEGRFAATTGRTDRVMFVPETLRSVDDLAVKN